MVEDGLSVLSFHHCIVIHTIYIFHPFKKKYCMIPLLHVVHS